jgi:hypothetical protein
MYKYCISLRRSLSAIYAKPFQKKIYWTLGNVHGGSIRQQRYRTK